MNFYYSEFKYHIRTLWDPIEVAIWANIFALLICQYYNSERVLEGLIIMNALIFFFGMLPDLIKYFRYLKVSKNIHITIDNEKRQIKVEKDNQIKEFSFDDIRSITRICTEMAGKRKNSKPRWGDFYYFDIDLKSREEIIITSLMTNEENISIDGKINQVQPQGKAWLSIQGRNIVNLQFIK